MWAIWVGRTGADGGILSRQRVSVLTQYSTELHTSMWIQHRSENPESSAALWSKATMKTRQSNADLWFLSKKNNKNGHTRWKATVRRRGRGFTGQLVCCLRIWILWNVRVTILHFTLGFSVSLFLRCGSCWIKLPRIKLVPNQGEREENQGFLMQILFDCASDDWCLHQK